MSLSQWRGPCAPATGCVPARDNSWRESLKRIFPLTEMRRVSWDSGSHGLQCCTHTCISASSTPVNTACSDDTTCSAVFASAVPVASAILDAKRMYQRLRPVASLQGVELGATRCVPSTLRMTPSRLCPGLPDAPAVPCSGRCRCWAPALGDSPHPLPAAGSLSCHRQRANGRVWCAALLSPVRPAHTSSPSFFPPKAKSTTHRNPKDLPPECPTHSSDSHASSASLP